jgi:hypothetical protein
MRKAMKVEAREYKLLVRPEEFANTYAAIIPFWTEIEGVVNTLPMTRAKGKLDQQETRTIVFLDMPNYTRRRQGLMLRQWIGDRTMKHTLKCRSEDWNFAAVTDVRAADGLKAEGKFEDDIAPPFRCGCSRSATITMPEDGKAGQQKSPKAPREATALFPPLSAFAPTVGPVPRRPLSHQ